MTTVKPLAGPVTTVKLLAGPVTTVKLLAGPVTTVKPLAGPVTQTVCCRQPLVSPWMFLCENLAAWKKLVNWCFEPSQPLGIISWLKETFIKRYIVETTNKTEMRPEEQRKKTESCRENLWNETQLKGP